MFHVKHSFDDTIAAIATPVGVGGIGVVRLSGPEARRIVSKFFLSSKAAKDFESHRIYHGWISSGGVNIDEVLLSFMAAPGTYTGEDIVEISCHGGRLAVKKALELAIEAGARMAEKGEFTKRAFLNGRIDLVKAEAVIDLINARSEGALIAAAGQLSGSLSGRVQGIRGELMEALSSIEAAVDFPDEIEAPGREELNNKLTLLLEKINGLIETAEEGRVLREGIRLVIVGKPNVGKSSLLNKLVQDDRVIVSSLPGTTRDTIEENLIIGGLPFVAIDTAGIRNPKNEVETQGINRARAEMGRADIVMIVLDASGKLSTEDEKVLLEGTRERAVVVLNKIDLGIKMEFNGQAGQAKKFFVSALSGEGVEALRVGLKEVALSSSAIKNDGRALINTRHKECLWRTKEALEGAINSLGERNPIDLLAIDLRAAITSLGEITGQDVSEEVIENIFRRFCVGK
jgi:tRNA modification GTPase